MNSSFSIDSNVYHIKNMGKKIHTINIHKIISDHPMIIYQMSIPIPFNKQQEIIKISYKKILSQNNEEVKKIIITQNYNYIPIFKNPIKSIKRKIHSIKFSNENYTENFIELKEKEKFKEIKRKKAEEIRNSQRQNNWVQSHTKD